MIYNKIIESDGRRTSVFVRSDGSIVLTEKHDINARYSPQMQGKPNSVILHGGSGRNGVRQKNIMIYDENGDALVELHYGSHSNPKHHLFGKVIDGERTGYHVHDVKIDGQTQSPRPYKPREMTEAEEKYLRR